MKRGNVRKTKKNSTVSQRDGTWRSVNELTGRGGKEKGICVGGERGGSRRRSFVDIHAFLVVVIAMVVVVLPQEDVRRERCRGRRRQTEREKERGYNRPT